MFFAATVQVTTARRVDLAIRRNDNPWRARFRLFNAAGAPLDMRGHGAKLQMRLYEGMVGIPNLAVSVPIYSYFLDSAGNKRTFSGGERFVTRDAPGASEILMTDTGFDVAIEADDIRGIPLGMEPGVPIHLSYDILITTPAGDENAWFEGRIAVRDGVTRPLAQDERDQMYHAFYEFEADQAA